MSILILFLLCAALNAQIPLNYHNNISPTYDETIKLYEYLARSYESANLLEYGEFQKIKYLIQIWSRIKQ